MEERRCDDGERHGDEQWLEETAAAQIIGNDHIGDGVENKLQTDVSVLREE